ncbi:MAG: YjbQ family protein [Planctomycetes bacterium]|nr:YjbQ family protein [Planctomycetota bacterium]
MAVETHRFEVSSKGNSQVINLSDGVEACLAGGNIQNGLVCVFVTGSTAAITTTEYEPGLVNHDLKAALEHIAPEDGRYVHEETWHDDNGHSHVRATLIGPSLTVPLVDGRMVLGTWQQIVLIDCDTRSRTRAITVQVVGEK